MEEKNTFEKEVEKTTRAVISKSTGFILAGLGFVVGLAWNDAVQTLVKTIFPQEAGTLIAKFVYAFIITVVLVFVSLRFEKKENKK